MKKFQLFLFLIMSVWFFIPMKGQGQGKFKEGYVVSTKGDTTSGYIKFWYKQRNPRNIKFKEKLEDETRLLSPLDISSFFAADEYYESRILMIDKSPYARNELYLNHLPFFKEREVVKDTVFLNVLVHGRINLLYLYDEENKPHFFVESQDHEIDELINHQYKVKVNQGGGIKTVLRQSRGYRRQLSFYLKGCRGMMEQIREIKLNLKEIVNIIRDYNSCQ